MKIASICGFSAYWGADLKPDILDATEGKRTVGGGEEAALRTAVELAARGHQVDAWWYGQSGTWRGVKFRSHYDDLHRTLRSTDYDAVVSFSDLRALEWAPKSAHGRRFFAQQLNDLWNVGDWNAVDCIISPAESHGQHLAYWGWKNKPYAVVHNGCDVEQYRGGVRLHAAGCPARTVEKAPCLCAQSVLSSPAPAWNERPMDVGYWSSPDRGLHHVLRAWPEVTKAIPSARLHVFYEIDKYLSLVQHAVGEYGARAQELFPLLVRAKRDPSVIFHGQVPRKVLAPIQLQCRVMCYPYDPTSYCEGFCGSVNQGIAAGCLVMTTPKDALPELYDGVVHWMRESPMQFEKTLAPQIVAALRGSLTNQNGILGAAGRWKPYSWAMAGDQIDRVVRGLDWKTTGDGADHHNGGKR